MAELTATQRADIQADLGIGADEAVFTNDELDRLYTRADADYNTAVYYAWRQLLADANKFHDYSAGQAKVSKSQIRAHIRDMVAFWKEEALTTANQVMLVGLNEIPPRHKDEPN